MFIIIILHVINHNEVLSVSYSCEKHGMDALGPWDPTQVQICYHHPMSRRMYVGVTLAHTEVRHVNSEVKQQELFHYTPVKPQSRTPTDYPPST